MYHALVSLYGISAEKVSRFLAGTICHLVSGLTLGTCLFAGIQLEPEAPRWGQDFVVRVTPDFPRGRLYSDDRVYVNLSTWHQDVLSTVNEKAVWDGEAFVARLKLPGNCEWASIRIRTPEKFFRGMGIAPRTDAGEMPPGTRIMASCRPRTDLSTCNEAIDRALTENPDLWWIYPKVWGLRERILKNLDSNEVIAQLRRMESQQKSPSLLRTLSMGYWLAKRSDRAFESLTELCTRFPGSRYSVQALNEAIYWISTQGLDHLSARLEKLQARVVDAAPTNPRLWKDRRSVLWLRSNSIVSLDAMRSLFEAWVEEDPADPHPYFLLANALSREGTSDEEAGRLIDRSLDLYYTPRAFVADKRLRDLAYRVRARLRLRNGDAAGALADIKMARADERGRSAEDLEIEAAIWKSIGHLRRSEEILVDAYRMGSATAEELLKDAYVARTGDNHGFKDYVMTRLTGDMPAPEPAPEIEGTTLDGTALTSESLRGKPVVVNFWFTSCGPCIREIPELNDLADEFAGKARFLAFATDDAEPIRHFLKGREFRYEIIPSSSRLARAFGVEAYPSHYIIDGNGNVVWRALGAGPKTVEILGDILQRLLNGKPIPVKGSRQRRG